MGQPLLHAVARAYERVVFPHTARRADHVIASSRYVVDSFGRMFAGKSTVVSPGVDVALFHETASPIPARLLFVGSLGKAAAYKGLVDLLLVVDKLKSRYPSMSLEVVGDGDGRGAFETTDEGLGLTDRVTFRGFLEGRELANAYCNASVIVLPTKYDSLPTVLLEAMSCGRPVISTLIGGIPELVTSGETGLLYDPTDASGLEDSLSQLLDDPALATSMGRAAALAVRTRRSWDVQAGKTNDVFSDVLHRRSPSPRVAVVTPFFTPRIGGVERYTEGVAQKLYEDGQFTPVVFTTGTSRWRTSVEDRDGIRVVRLGRGVTVSNTPVNPAWLVQLPILLWRDRVRLVWANAPVPLFGDLAVMASGRRPSVLTYHSGSMAKKKGSSADLLISAYESWILPHVRRAATCVVGVSDVSLGVLPGGLIIHPAVDVDVFSPPLDLPVGEPALLFVGRLEKNSSWKGTDVLLKAFALVRNNVPSTRLVIVGDGDALGDLRALAVRLGVGDSVEWKGALTGQSLVGEFQRSAIVVLPSLTEAESFGMVLIEGMACGKPVVGSAVGGIPAVIRDGIDGVLVPPGDVQRLAEVCVDLLTNPERRLAMGSAGRLRATCDFSLAAQSLAYTKLFSSLLSRSVMAES
jgi:glycosyltransferase involved in cell wall biosynthesis